MTAHFPLTFARLFFPLRKAVLIKLAIGAPALLLFYCARPYFLAAVGRQAALAARSHSIEIPAGEIYDATN